MFGKSDTKLVMKRLPIDVSNFRTMIDGNYLYIDKTEAIYNLIQKRRFYFLSRPRRFGKSLLISTLHELFQGNKELFKDLWIGSSDYMWSAYPVIRLDFSALSRETSHEFKQDLIWHLEEVARNNGIDLSGASSVGTKLKSLITQLAQKAPVVVLVDEYDSPLLHNLEKPAVAKALQRTLKDVFSVIKSCDGYGHIHAIFITGVTKFAKTTIFSGINNLYDLTLRPEAAALLGYTERELHHYFSDYVKEYAQLNGMTVVDVFENLKTWYNGYRFSSDTTKVYNPYSILHCFEDKRIANYWLETGTPGFLIELLKSQYEEFDAIESIELSAESLGTFELSDIPIIPVLLQAGYLTIADYDDATQTYKLTYPNAEVRLSFKKYLLISLSNTTIQKTDTLLARFRSALKTADMSLFCATLKHLFANIPHQLHIAKEAYYHSLLHFLCDVLGFENVSEVSVATGRIDMVLQTHDYVFVFEFKLKATGKKALDQILDHKYYAKYMRYDKPIMLVGISFKTKGKHLLIDYVSQMVGKGRQSSDINNTVNSF